MTRELERGLRDTLPLCYLKEICIPLLYKDQQLCDVGHNLLE